MIQVSHLTKRYGARVAVDDVSFDVAAGEVVGFLGPNGAGKSTTLRILAGFLGPTRGEVRVSGHDAVADSIAARRCIGYMPEHVPVYPEMRVVEYLAFRAELKRVPRRARPEHVEDAMRKTGVVEVANKRIGHLSRGYRQRVGMADAIVARPPVVILDEPTAGLDPNQIREARSLIRELGQRSAVLVSTHILSEIEACATRVIVIHKGRLVAAGPTGDVRALRKEAHVDLTVRGPAAEVQAAVAGAVEGARASLAAGSEGDVTRWRVSFPSGSGGGESAERVVSALVAAGLGVREVRTPDGSLEDVFAALTSDAREEAGR